MEKAAQQPFEVSVDRLEAIVRELESGAPPLEKSLELFAEGMKLAETCREQLEAAEGRVEILIRRAGDKMSAEPFSIESRGESRGEKRGPS
jgi:exodeoxyribonuclease VII small subunit